MSAADILVNVAQGWNRAPVGVAAGTERTGVAAALWTHEQDDTQEVRAAPDQLRHIVCVGLTDWSCDMFLDERLAFRKRFHSGAVSIVRSGLSARAVNRGAWKVLHFYVPDSLVQELTEVGGLSPLSGDVELLDPQSTRDPVIERIAQEVLAEMGQAQLLSRLRIDALGQDLAIHLLRRHSNLSSTCSFVRERVRGGLAPFQVKRVTDYLDDQLATDVSLADLAALTGLSTFHLCRAFKQSTGLPPHRWRLARRVERAREMLESTDLPIIEVAAAVGYDDPGQLATVFRKALGVTPTQYRRERRG